MTRSYFRFRRTSPQENTSEYIGKKFVPCQAMASSLTLRLWKFMDDISYRVGFLPFQLSVDAPSCVQLEYCGKTRAAQCRLSTAFHVLIQASLILVLGAYYDLTHDIPMSIRLQYYFTCSVVSFTLPLHMLFVLYPRRIHSLHGTFFRFNEQLCKYLSYS